MSKNIITFGSFDLFHAGHVGFLYQASGLGRLFVGIGDDARVRHLKGEGRPIMPASERFALVSTCEYVHDAFVISISDEVSDHLKYVADVGAHILVSGEQTHLSPEFLQALKAQGVEYRQLKSEPPTTTEIIKRCQSIKHL